MDPLAGMRMDVDGETDVLGDGLSIGVYRPAKHDPSIQYIAQA
jgi:hypothetical protein